MKSLYLFVYLKLYNKNLQLLESLSDIEIFFYLNILQYINILPSKLSSLIIEAD